MRHFDHCIQMELKDGYNYCYIYTQVFENVEV